MQNIIWWACSPNRDPNWIWTWVSQPLGLTTTLGSDHVLMPSTLPPGHDGLENKRKNEKRPETHPQHQTIVWTTLMFPCTERMHPSETNLKTNRVKKSLQVLPLNTTAQQYLRSSDPGYSQILPISGFFGTFLPIYFSIYAKIRAISIDQNLQPPSMKRKIKQKAN